MVSYLTQDVVRRGDRLIFGSPGHPMVNLERTLRYWVLTGIFLNMRVGACRRSYRCFGYPMYCL